MAARSTQPRTSSTANDERHAAGLAQDVGGWFDEYQQDLARHTEAIRGINERTAGQVQAQIGSVRGLDQQVIDERHAAANTSAQQRGATAADFTKTGSDASQVRQAMLASLGSEMAGRGRADEVYADTQPNVVVPGQKLQAQAAARRKLEALLREKDDFRYVTGSEIKRDEAKTVAERAVEAERNRVALAAFNLDAAPTVR